MTFTVFPAAEMIKLWLSSGNCKTVDGPLNERRSNIRPSKSKTERVVTSEAFLPSTVTTVKPEKVDVT